MIGFTAILVSKTGKEQQLEEALTNMVANVQNEEGTVTYILCRSQDNPKQFTCYEKYKDQAALDYHNSTPHMSELIAKLDVLLEEDVKINYYDEIATIRRSFDIQ
jgi:quinol monooxygenase YgiN